MSAPNARPAPPFDDELARVLAGLPIPSTVDAAWMVSTRKPTPAPVIDTLLTSRGLVREDRYVPGLGADPDVLVSVFRTTSGRTDGPGFYYAHGGGMVIGDQFSGVDKILDWVKLFDGVAVSVDYRLAPEHPDPAPLHDCYAGLAWTAAHAAELGFSADQLIAVGLSAGGGLVAGALLMARDQSGPALCAQILMCPMLDDRNESLSSHQIQGIGVWDHSSNQSGWAALLGDRSATPDVSPYTAPARATDLSGLPPTYIDCGSAEVFRDECVAYAQAIWAAGGVADLHVWAGGFHGFEGIAPTAALSREARGARTDFIRRVLGQSAGPGSPDALG